MTTVVPIRAEVAYPIAVRTSSKPTITGEIGVLWSVWILIVCSSMVARGLQLHGLHGESHHGQVDHTTGCVSSAAIVRKSLHYRDLRVRHPWNPTHRCLSPSLRWIRWFGTCASHVTRHEESYASSTSKHFVVFSNPQ